MATEKKYAPIEMIKCHKPQATAYGKALTMNWFGKASPDVAKTTVGLTVRLLALLFAIVGGISTVFCGCFLLVAESSISTLALAWPAVLMTSLITLHICTRVTDRENKKLLADPTEKFNWQIAKAAGSFNNRAISFNAILAAVELGKVNAPEEELSRVYEELFSTREELTLNIRMLEAMWQMPNTEPELAANLEELRDVKEVLMHELRQSEYLAEALPAGKIREALQNECVYRELSLLSEAKK